MDTDDDLYLMIANTKKIAKKTNDGGAADEIDRSKLQKVFQFLLEKCSRNTVVMANFDLFCDYLLHNLPALILGFNKYMSGKRD